MGTTDATRPARPFLDSDPRRTHGHGVKSPHIRLTIALAQPGSPGVGPREPRALSKTTVGPNRGPQNTRPS